MPPLLHVMLVHQYDFFIVSRIRCCYNHLEMCLAMYEIVPLQAYIEGRYLLTDKEVKNTLEVSICQM